VREKSMKKHLMLFGMVVLFICVGLSGCHESEEISIIGHWTNGEGFVLTFNEGGKLNYQYGSLQHDGIYSIMSSELLSITSDIDLVYYTEFDVQTQKGYNYDFQDADTLLMKSLAKNSEYTTWTRI